MALQYGAPIWRYDMALCVALPYGAELSWAVLSRTELG